jgi:hypothetical protein
MPPKATEDPKPEPVFEDLHSADDADDGLPPLDKGERRTRGRDDGIDLEDPFAGEDDEDEDEDGGLPPRGARAGDDEEDEDEDEDEEDGDGGEAYGKRAAKRIKREVRLKNSFRDLAASAMQERDAALAELARARKGGGEGKAAKEIEAKIADLRAKLRQAKDDGETEKELELEEQLVDLRVDLREAKRAEAHGGGDGAGAERGVGQRQPTPNPYAAEFRQRHRKWWDSQDPRAVRLREKVTLIDAQVARDMQQRGVSEYDERYWRELDKRLSREIPEHFGARGRGRERTATPTVGLRRVPGGGEGRRTERLSPSDVATMRTFGLDPSNKAHVAEFRANRAR